MHVQQQRSSGEERSRKMKIDKEGVSRIGLHLGNVIALLANTYHTIAEAILEAVQNAIDANARNILVRINMKRRSIVIEDDGEGASVRYFEQALTSIAETMKEKRAGKLGRFGLGLIAFVGKCTSYSFTSGPARSSYVEWIFDTKALSDSKDDQGVPRKVLDDHRFSRTISGIKKGGKSGSIKYVPWRTQVRVRNFSDDRVIGRISIDSIASMILEKYSVTMRRRGVEVTLCLIEESGREVKRIVRADQPKGDALPVLNLKSGKQGTTSVKLFLSPRTAKGRQGKIVLGETCDEHRISANQFARGVYDVLPREVIEALCSGVFEGEITNDQIKLSPQRGSFVRDDSWLDFLASLEDWYKQQAVPYLDDAREESKARRYQELGERSQRAIDAVIRASGLEQLISTFTYGTTGTGHTNVGQNVRGETCLPAVDASKSGKRVDGNGSSVSQTRNPEAEERKNHRPNLVSGPRGRRRVVVKGGSQGLCFVYEEDPGSERVYWLDAKTGELHFNIRHPLWVLCDEASNSALMRFQESVALHALVMLGQPDDLHPAQQLAMQEMLSLQAHLIVEGEKAAGRTPGRRSLK